MKSPFEVKRYTHVVMVIAVCKMITAAICKAGITTSRQDPIWIFCRREQTIHLPLKQVDTALIKYGHVPRKETLAHPMKAMPGERLQSTMHRVDIDNAQW